MAVVVGTTEFPACLDSHASAWSFELGLLLSRHPLWLANAVSINLRRAAFQQPWCVSDLLSLFNGVSESSKRVFLSASSVVPVSIEMQANSLACLEYLLSEASISLSRSSADLIFASAPVYPSMPTANNTLAGEPICKAVQR